MRLALGIEYDGCRYHGWQTQLDNALPTIQEALERGISFVAAHPVHTICAGRTDAGVHGLGQVVHFDTQAERDERAWTMGVNSVLAKDIAIQWVKEVPETFHARFSALSRRYQYVIYNHPLRSGIWQKRAAWFCRPLNEQRMQSAADFLLGEHDFSAFRGAGCQAKSPIRTIQQLEIKRSGYFISVTIVANAFLYHMVRNIVGVLMRIGAGDNDPSWIEELLQSESRQHVGVTAPAQGLYFVDVVYPEHFFIPSTQMTFPFI